MPPEPMPGLLPWFFAFWELSTDRRYPGAPIPRQSIAEYPVAADESGTFRNAMRAMDAAYLRFLDKPMEERQSLPVAGPGLLRGKRKDG